MLEKQDFYYGAAIYRLAEDGRLTSLKIHGSGMVANGNTWLLPKYVTKVRSPWRFTLTKLEMAWVREGVSGGHHVVLPLICGGEGICAVTGKEALYLSWGDTELPEPPPGWVGVIRGHNTMFEAYGLHRDLSRKVAVTRWPSIVYDFEENLIPIKNKTSLKLTTQIQ